MIKLLRAFKKPRRKTQESWSELRSVQSELTETMAIQEMEFTLKLLSEKSAANAIQTDMRHIKKIKDLKIYKT